jgi:hypothetical protein
MDVAHHFRRWLLVLLAGASGLLAAPARAEADPPGRVGRVAELQGRVAWFDEEDGRWAEAERNLPLTQGDRIATGRDGGALLRVGSTSLRLGAGTELEVLRLDDEAMVFKLHDGSLALRVRSGEVAREIELLTAEARLRPLRAGHYRIDRRGERSFAAAWRGELRIDDVFGFDVAGNQRFELWRDASGGLRSASVGLPDDALATVALREDGEPEPSVALRYVSPEMTGVEELDRVGRWETHPEVGAVWFPLEVRAGWAPYRHGRWAWVRPWGWTWIDEAPWGFAPFHHGRWVWWRDRWGWAPGPRVARPVFAPALVAWVGGGGVSVSVRVGGPPRAWVPLAPREAYVPWYRHTPVHVGRVNGPWRGDDRSPGRGWAHERVPGAVTVLPPPGDRRGERRPDERPWVSWPERRERAEHPPRPDRAELPARPERPDRTERPDRGYRSDRIPRPEGVMTPAPPLAVPAPAEGPPRREWRSQPLPRFERPERRERPDRIEPPQPRPERADPPPRPERVEPPPPRAERPEPPRRAERNDERQGMPEPRPQKERERERNRDAATR